MLSDSNKNQPITNLYLTVAKDRVPAFFPLLAQGFTVKTRIGCSLQDFLCNQIGLDSDYVEKRLQTIFLDGKAVDNVKTAVVRANATLALSAAMPGLAGVTLRRGGVYAAMRHQITHNKNTEADITADGEIVLKLFNLVAQDIGPLFLMQGIWSSGNHLKNFFQRAPDHLRAGIRSVEIDGNRREAAKLVQIDWQQHVFFKLKAV